MTRFMLDTNTVSYIVKNQSPHARAKLREYETQSQIVLSAIVEAELQFGVRKRQSALLSAAVEQFLLQVLVLPWDSAAARSYAELRLKLLTAGKILAAMDLMIAAHAHATGATLVTNDLVFQYVENLTTVNWAIDVESKRKA